jgi:cytochrome c-type biogenesis protein CcmH
MLLVPIGVLAQDQYSPETLRIGRKLLCPVCSGETIADSQSGTARQMLATVEEKVQAGESEGEILDFFVARYGESVLADPPKEGLGLALWWLPVIVVLVGALAVGLFLRERTRPGVVVAAQRQDVRTAADDELEAIADEVLGRERGRERGDGMART